MSYPKNKIKIYYHLSPKDHIHSYHENSLEYLQSGLGILVKITDTNNQKTCNYGYGVFDAQTHKVFMFKEVFRKKPQEFYSTKFEEED